MKWNFLLLLSIIFVTLNAVSIYDIQYTTTAGDGTYPSTYAGTIVSTSGICTGIDFNDGSGYFISMPEGGAWKSIFVYDSSHNPTPGDLIEITGQVWEYRGWTEFRNLTAYNLVSSNNPLPPVLNLTTQQINEEPYESVLAKVSNATCTEGFNQYDEWLVNDGSGNAKIDGGFFDQDTISEFAQIGVVFTSITGIISYSYNEFRLNPRNAQEVITSSDFVSVTIPSLEADINSAVSIPLNTSNIALGQGFTSFSFNFYYDPNIISYTGYDQTNTLSSTGNVIISNQIPGSFHLQFVSNGILTGSGALIKFNFMTQGFGTSPLNAEAFQFNETPITVIPGQIIVNPPAGVEYPDTVTVIQQPLPNIPVITVPGEQFIINCSAPSNTTGWTASLQRKSSTINMPVNTAVYSTNPPRWVIQVTAPNVPLYELYDLKITANGGISDVSKHSVQIIPTRKTNYYFVHITDTHTPTHTFWPEDGYDTDSTETEDLREVIRDINIIRPEFVLLTGDLVNQGENEDLENLHWFSKAQRLLLELEVPLYLVSGNHDIGGWDSQPPSDGTARRDWWKFFGWAWLTNTSTANTYHTQDYSFNYGQLHFTGLESYINYDNWLPNIYGEQSFTQQQIQWLQNDLNNNPTATKVLFYHDDFSNQINLNSLGVSMALWGHIHADQGSITQAPYSLATEATCDGARAYRVIRANGAQLQPYATVSAGPSGSQIQVSFFPSNYGIADSVRATLVNNQPLTFENSLVKFIMPAGNAEYDVAGGIIDQIDRTATNNTVYVRANLINNQTTYVSLWDQAHAVNDQTDLPQPLIVSSAYPNPFTSSTQISIKSEVPVKITVDVFNIKGELIRSLYKNKAGETLSLQWNGRNNKGQVCQSGIYFIKVRSANQTQVIKTLFLK